MAQCHATSKGSGERCKRQAIAGAAVCRVHGGAAPQVRAKAQERLLALVDPALAVLSHAMRQKAKQLPVAVQAARDVLDRNNLGGKQFLELSGGVIDAEVLRQRRAARLAAEGRKELPAPAEERLD